MNKEEKAAEKFSDKRWSYLTHKTHPCGAKCPPGKDCIRCAFLAGIAWRDKHPKNEDIFLSVVGEKNVGMSYAALSLKDAFEKKGAKK